MIKYLNIKQYKGKNDKMTYGYYMENEPAPITLGEIKHFPSAPFTCVTLNGERIRMSDVILGMSAKKLAKTLVK